MTDMVEKQRNSSLWLGLVFALGAVLFNVVLFANFSGKRVLVWLSLLLALLALIFAGRGLWRIFALPRRGRILGSIAGVFSLLLAGLAIFAFFQSRALPLAVGAPQVGQKVPDFTMADTMGRPVSLNQLFAPVADGVPPKEVLLIFYRGYW